jgi:hypothetical protein
MTYRYIAQWYLAHGRYEMKKAPALYQQADGFLGFPGQMLRGILKHGMLFLRHAFNRQSSLVHWQILFRCIGMWSEYRNIVQNIPKRKL